MRRRNHFTIIAIYAAVITAALSIATWRMHAQSGQATPQPAASPQPSPTVKPSFSLSTNRTYGTGERARVFINYQAIDHLDFRVYRVNDPVKFFKQLNDPHQMGEQERSEVAAAYQQRPSVLQRLRAFKLSIYRPVKNYLRGQLRRESRQTLTQTLRGEGERLPLNVADYARVPLLNRDQLVRAWRQMLAPTESQYDARMVTLDQLNPGVHLIEAVNGELRAYTIAVVTDLTMINKTAPDGEMLVYAVDRQSGAPQAGVSVEVVRGKRTLATGVTDRSGLLKTRINQQPSTQPAAPRPEDFDPEVRSQVGRNSYLIMASGRDHFTISDLEPYYFGGDEDEGEEGFGPSSVTSYIYTDRPVYRPDQKVYFKGILRQLGESGYEMVGGRTVQVTIEDPNNGKVLEKDLPLSARGTFSGEVEVAGGAPLGGYRLMARAGRATAHGYFEVLEYKKPEYKVKVTTPKPFVPVGEKTRFTIEARYFFGEPVKNADVQYYIYRSRYYHWWWRSEEDADPLGGGDEDEESGYYGYGNDLIKEGTGRLNAQGLLEVEFDVPPLDEKDPRDYTYRLEAQVTDAARRVIEGRASFVGTRGSIVAYARAGLYFYYQGETARIQVKTADYEGRPVAAKVRLKFIERRWDRIEKESEGQRKYYDYKLIEKELAAAEVNTNAQGQAVYDYLVPVIGSIKIQAIVPEGGKQVVSEGGSLWVADRNNRWGDLAYDDYGAIKLVPDKQTYQPGETARVLALLPTDQTHLLVTTEMAQVLTARQIDAVARAVVIDVPIEARYAPNVYLSVAYVKDGEMFFTDKVLNVPARDKFLSLEIIPNKKEYKPRETASYTILARNADGSPASGTEVSLGVVDEAIYSIRPESAGDIRRAFYGRRYNRISTHFSTAYYFSGYAGDKPIELAKNKPAYQLADFKNESQYAEPTIRKEFKDTAYWQPDVITGADGKATVSVKLPDNLTTWRATARAVTADTRVGSSVGKVLARKDLILRLETPRFLAEGDTATLSGIVHNYLDADKVTKISIEVSGARLLDPAEQTVTITKQGEHRVDWRVAAQQIGEVKLLAKALTDTESDALEIPLPVVPAGLKQTKGGTMTLAEESAERTFSYDLPPAAHPQARSLRIEASPSIAGTLFGALDYLTSYPYGCTEQTMSSFLPNVIVAQALQEVKTASLRAANDLGRKVQRGLDRLYGFQHDDGGWGWWQDDPTDPFMTAYVVDGLMMASRAGYAIENYRIMRGRAKLKQMIDAGKAEDGKPINPETYAYMIYALQVSGEAEARYANDLFARRGDSQPYGRALLALTLKLRGDEARARQMADEIERSARVNEFDAHWESRREPMLDFTPINDTEATALSLKALSQLKPQSPLLPKAARWLVANRANGYFWESTKQTAFAVYGLTDYLKVSQELSPDYTVEVYLNGEQVLARRMAAADAASAQAFVVERKGSAVASANQVRVVKRGRGMLYLSSALSYFTKEEEVAASASSELRLTREYLRLRVTESGGQAKWTVEPLTGELRSGDLIVSRLKVQGARARYLMIEDPIPAGCEQVERVSGINLNYSEGRWSDWYSAREFRDQKTALFVNYFDGDATFQYALRVQVPGEFRAAPARAELMYQPTVQANAASAKLSILEKK
jgi:uncharacterized protein YfaS (alpha-2-macroglobulin family)